MFQNDLEGVILNLATFPRQSRKHQLVLPILYGVKRSGDLFSLSPFS